MNRIIILVGITILLATAACKKDPLSKLPPETQTGANTFGCLVNGEAWVPKGTDYGSGTNVVAKYEYAYPSTVGYYFNISATNYESSPISFFVLGADSIKLTEGLKLKLMLSRKGVSAGGYWVGFDYEKTYTTTDSLAGEIYFKKLDDANQIASGTFWFDAINGYNELIQVREGRFDVKYTR